MSGFHPPFGVRALPSPLACAGLLAALILGAAEASVAASCPLDRADKLARQGRFEAALEALKSCPSEPKVHRIRGIGYHGLFKSDSAIAQLKAAFEAGLKDDGVRLPLAEAFLWKKDFRNAALVMDGIKNRTSADYFKLVARKHEILGDMEEAVKLYDKAIALEKLPYGTLERKAIVLSWMKRFDESIAVFDAILKVKVVSRPLKVRCLVRKAEVMSWKGELDPALAQLQRALALDKGNLEARFVKGRILEWKGDYQAAKAVYKDVLSLSPGQEQAKLKLDKLSWVE